MPHSSQHDVLKKWLAALLWIGVICLESTDLMSSSNTGSFIYSLLAPFWPHIDPIKFGEFHAILRKVGHFVGYGILSFLLFRAWKATLKTDYPARWTWLWAVVSFFMSALVASLDEWHQTFIPSRTGTYKDVLLDSAAALCVQILLFLLLSNRTRASAAPNSA